MTTSGAQAVANTVGFSATGAITKQSTGIYQLNFTNQYVAANGYAVSVIAGTASSGVTVTPFYNAGTTASITIQTNGTTASGVVDPGYVSVFIVGQTS